MKIERIGVIGAGTMGNGIAQTFAVAGYPVVLNDVAPEALDRARASIGASLGKLVGKGKLAQEAADAALDSITSTTQVEDMSGCDLVIEAIVERLDAKTSILQRLDEICGESTIFASNTSFAPCRPKTRWPTPCSRSPRRSARRRAFPRTATGSSSTAFSSR
jgi:3-hydroxybutyryl-CoA dehydrogenase